ncbi:MAG: FlgD immunoglobulin-like domain containing protein [Candidatus Latescibacteria bacterium]|jgi:hypothetical protein|nr:hypothetical protein [Gemmatimonadaceae bacterium]MDP6017313.1 FlgD immunoglobulin-like domain containing protein [Candidatus Latescibacterota bacterium]MDP7448976.1 FlgD immunoglobulin-like domain containing protein [Candidatus Latescibacterota bacterium]HJP32227.1 FlgD immunoglobulin-like domain containing protein [Candidatus Latescibacterota bacterium]|tara:strand:+ start:438 stop:701 length:264 start_codon:yes stop_codon:yes gene_type:complete
MDDASLADVPFRLATASQIELVVFDLLGQRLATVTSGWYEKGGHRSIWNGRTDAGAAAASGVYLYRLLSRTPGTDTQAATGKVLLLR